MVEEKYPICFLRCNSECRPARRDAAAFDCPRFGHFQTLR